ncbi:hypothetical protein [Lysinibacillus parviboronicapiens]|uniref:hypothetical protein n=1 Tax=Lysinibacillus parviboronicapiens TaxID=436516 RepID=UPI000D3736B4|nr:hypothetical protein [Lysinibacillus parviboronicapiens]
MSFKFDGFDELEKELKSVGQAAQKLDSLEVSFDELLNKAFMSKYTKYNSFDEFLKAGNFIVETQEDFEAIPDDEFDVHVVNHSSFEDWQTMLDTASSEYFVKKLNF